MRVGDECGIARLLPVEEVSKVGYESGLVEDLRLGEMVDVARVGEALEELEL